MTFRTRLSHALAVIPCLLLGSGCKGLGSFGFDSEGDGFCFFDGYVNLRDTRELDTGTGWLEGLCSSQKCGEEFPLAVGAKGHFALYFQGSMRDGELVSNDPDVIRVEQVEVEERCIDGEPGLEVAGTFEVVGPGTGWVGWMADDTEQAGLTLHTARAETLNIHFDTYPLDGLDLDWDEDAGTGTFTPRDERIPSLQKVPGGIVARVGRGFQVTLVARDADDRRLVLGGGPTTEDPLVDSTLESAGLLSFEPPHGGTNLVYDVDVEKAGETTLVASLPDLGLTARRSLQTLDPEDYDATLEAP